MTKPKPKPIAPPTTGPSIAARHDDPNAKNLPKSAKTVTVACKFPHGLNLRVMDFREVKVQTREGIRLEQQSFQIGPSIKINGPIAPARGASPHETAGGYALTHNVDADAMQAWMEQNAEHDLVINNQIFIASNRNDGRDRSEEHAEVRTNTEPLTMPMKKGEKVTDRRVLAMGGGDLQVAERA